LRAVNLTILGAGAWGTALAVHAAHRAPTLLWARDVQQVQAMHKQRKNARYLPDIVLPKTLQITADFDEALAHASSGLTIVATPMAGLQSTLQRLPRSTAGVLWLCKGFQQDSGLLPSEVAQSLGLAMPMGVLSGPSFALEVARGLPAALVVASCNPNLCQEAVAALHGDSLRIYRCADPVGVEVGGAVKNVLAIATGIADGLHLGLNARAALITRGLAEMTRLGVALGAQSETFMGLGGLGDLVLTATGNLSRNRKVGTLLASGLGLPDILQKLGHVAEGVACAATVTARARQCGVSMPIAAAVVQVLQAQLTPHQAMAGLMSRDAQPEFG
jgi:glycerol-3-phosphate dehydrogenase (NAD(P)+)